MAQQKIKSIGIKVDMVAFKYDESDATIEDIATLNNAVTETFIAHGFYIGGIMSPCDDNGNEITIKKS